VGEDVVDLTCDAAPLSERCRLLAQSAGRFELGEQHRCLLVGLPHPAREARKQVERDDAQLGRDDQPTRAIRMHGRHCERQRRQHEHSQRARQRQAQRRIADGHEQARNRRPTGLSPHQGRGCDDHRYRGDGHGQPIARAAQHRDHARHEHDQRGGYGQPAAVQ
jgi:hypothetical protein